MFLRNPTLPSMQNYEASATGALACTIIAAVEGITDGLSLTSATAFLSACALGFAAANQAMEDMPRQLIMNTTNMLFHKAKKLMGQEEPTPAPAAKKLS